MEAKDSSNNTWCSNRDVCGSSNKLSIFALLRLLLAGKGLVRVEVYLQDLLNELFLALLPLLLAGFILLREVVLGGVELEVRADDDEIVEVGVVPVGGAGIGDVETSQRFKLHEVMAEEVLQIVLLI